MEKKAKLNLETFNRSIRMVGTMLDRSRLKWFLCFGCLLGMVREKNILAGDTDIDIGLYYEDGDERLLMSIFERLGYFQTKIIRNNKNNRLMYACYESEEDPCVDVFLWYYHDGIRYHTYDHENQRKEIPREYYLKGIPADLIAENRIKKVFFGKGKNKPLEQAVSVPIDYGAVLDYWYPDFSTPRQGESKAKHEIRTNNMKKLKDRDFVKKQLASSEKRYEAYLKTISEQLST